MHQRTDSAGAPYHPSDGQTRRGIRTTLLLVPKLAAVVAVALAGLSLPAAQAAPAAPAATTALEAATLATSPAYYYPLDEQPGATSAADISGNGAPALEVADTWPGAGGTAPVTFGTDAGPGGQGTAAAFGGGQYLTGGPSLTTSAYSAMVWFKVPAVDYNSHTLLAAQRQKLDEGTTWAAWVDYNRGAGFVAPRSLPASTWHQLVVTGDGSTSTMYLDGSKADSSTMRPVTAGALSVGSQPGEARFNALIGDAANVAGWTRVLTPAEVAAMWTAGGGHAVTVPARSRCRAHAWQVRAWRGCRAAVR